LYLGDVLYLYAFIRKMALGKLVPTVLVCPNCSMKNKRDLDLDGLDVRVMNDPKHLIQPVELQDGVKIFGELRKQLRVRPPRWQVMSNPDVAASNNDAEKTVALIRECVCGAEGVKDGQPVVISDVDLDEMSKMDILLLERAIEATPGPQLIVELKCTACRVQTTMMLDYRYENFFTIAST
jgi:hypothetical protein